ncbi:MAG TPA: LemA family protein [Kineosporiaceae bacterium]
MTALIVAVVALVLLGIAVLWAVGVYNGLIRLRRLAHESWRQIDAELTRRLDLVPKLVETVRAHASQEAAALDTVLRARDAASAAGSRVPERVAAEGALSSALGRLFAIAETYPAVTANPDVEALQGELTDVEDRVAAGRRFYNANVRELNSRVESFPTSLFARAFGVAGAEHFEATDLAARQASAARLDPTDRPPT